MTQSTHTQVDVAPASGWKAALRLRFAEREGRTYLLERQHVGPLRVQRPFYPEDGVCHSYIVHPPGGVVGGDDLSTRVEVESGASVLLTTPAASKFYRSQGAYAKLSQVFTVHDAGTFEWLPQETIYYRGARVRANTLVNISAHSRFIGWEIACLGLPARDEIFDLGELTLGFELNVDGKPRWFDRLRLDGEGAARTAVWGLGGRTAIGTMLAFPATATMVDELRHVNCAAVELAFTLVDQVLVCRALGAQAEPIRNALIECWQRLRPAILDRAAVLPRIWAT